MDAATLFFTSLASAAGKKAVSEAVKVLRELIGLQEEQLAMLRTIEVKVDALLQGPFYTGRQQLEYALRAWREPNDRERLLQDARRSFAEALGQDHEPLRRSFAHVHLACVWLALDSSNDVPLELKRGHIEALRAVNGVVYRKKSGLQNLWQRIDSDARLNHQYTTLRMLSPIERYVNDLAKARQSWGATKQEAPILVGARMFEDTYEEVYREQIQRSEVVYYRRLQTWLQQS